MPEAKRDTIHALFDSHTKIDRKVRSTKKGYISSTTSDDPKVVKLLQSHVAQMKKRLESGLRVRRWDPAFDEYVDHYEDITFTIKNVSNGVKIKASGKTAAARKVLRNHASVISKFVENGWDEHDKPHPRSLTPNSDAASKKADNRCGCGKKGCR